jgi:diaminopimelate epimerase
MHVVKMHGAHNDFVLVDARRDRIVNPNALAREVCNRRGGIGADGLLVVQSSSIADARMTIVNADGSEAEMCGNGIRCFARYLDENGEGDELAVETASGIVRTNVVSRDPEYLVKVTLPAPEFMGRDDENSDDSAASGIPSDALIRVGNPHAVLLRDSLENIDLEEIAAEFQRTVAGGINVHVATAVDGHTMRVKHWERGVGPTQACGTGSAACAVAGIAGGLVQSPVAVRVPGGTLTIEWNGDELTMTGPAIRVFDADLARAE